MSSIDIRTELPGAKSREILARRDAAVVRGLARLTPVVAKRAHGATVVDVDGNTFLDFAGGLGALSVGHTPEEVCRVVRDQAEQLIHLCAIVGTYEPYVALAEQLNHVVPISGPKKTLLCNAGVEAVENAVKIARYSSKRPAIIAFEGAYHGRSLLALSLTSKYGVFKKGFGPFPSEICRVPYPNCYRCPHCREEGSCTMACFEDLERALVAQVDPSEVAAIIIEPVLREGGFVPAPFEYLRRLRALCSEHGILLIADEIQSGFGRTGRWFAFEHADIEPDIVIMAKSIAAGLPMAAVTGRADIMDAPHVGGLGGTFGGNPLACVAALKTIELVERDQLLARAENIGSMTLARFQTWKERYSIVGDARGLGAMLAFELVTDVASRKPNMEATLRITERAFQRGLLLLRAGLYTNCVRTLMPLTTSDEQLEEGLAVLEEAVALADSDA